MSGKEEAVYQFILLNKKARLEYKEESEQLCVFKLPAKLQVELNDITYNPICVYFNKDFKRL